MRSWTVEDAETPEIDPEQIATAEVLRGGFVDSFPLP
jgi:hypothetical protein